MKVALFHEFFIQYGGAERILEVIHDMFPDAPVYTLLYDPDQMPESYRKWDIRPLLRLPRVLSKRYKAFFPIYPFVINRLLIDDVDLVINSFYAYGLGLRTGPDTKHLAYCITPMRFVWVQRDQYRSKMPLLAKPFFDFICDRLAKWDVEQSKRPTKYLAESAVVAERVKRFYGRDAEVLHPPIETSLFSISEESGDHFLMACRLTLPYKQVDYAINQCNRLGLRLRIAGDGEARGYLESIAGPTIEFLGRLSTEALNQEYGKCRALIVPSEEDFGMATLEANACGKPVISYRGGGALETILDGETGVFFDAYTDKAFDVAFAQFQNARFDPHRIRARAEEFSRPAFIKKLNAYISSL